MQRAVAFLITIAVTVGSLAAFAVADERVTGYTRKNGTYVQPHYRSSPDGSPYNNYSYPGNVNPYTGKQATGNPATYLRDHGYGDKIGTSGQRPNSSNGW